MRDDDEDSDRERIWERDDESGSKRGLGEMMCQIGREDQERGEREKER